MCETVIPVASPELLAEHPLDAAVGPGQPHPAARRLARRRRQLPGLVDVAGGARRQGRGRHARAALQPVQPGDRGGRRRPRRGPGQADPGPGDLDAGRLVEPFQIATAVDFAYYVVHPKAKGRLPQVKAFVGWITAEAAAHEAALMTIDNGAGILGGGARQRLLGSPNFVVTAQARDNMMRDV